MKVDTYLPEHSKSTHMYIQIQRCTTHIYILHTQYGFLSNADQNMCIKTTTVRQLSFVCLRGGGGGGGGLPSGLE